MVDVEKNALNSEDYKINITIIDQDGVEHNPLKTGRSQSEGNPQESIQTQDIELLEGEIASSE